jgi:hypothetical protein
MIWCPYKMNILMEGGGADKASFESCYIVGGEKLQDHPEIALAHLILIPAYSENIVHRCIAI